LIDEKIGVMLFEKMKREENISILIEFFDSPSPSQKYGISLAKKSLN